MLVFVLLEQMKLSNSLVPAYLVSLYHTGIVLLDRGLSRIWQQNDLSSIELILERLCLLFGGHFLFDNKTKY